MDPRLEARAPEAAVRFAAIDLHAAGGVAATVVVAAAILSILLGVVEPVLLPPGVRPLVGNLVLLTAPLAALAACVLAARRPGGARESWEHFALACVSAVVGQLLWAGDELVRHVPIPFPSASFWCFVLAHVFLISGALLALRPVQVPRLRVEVGLDGALLMLVAALLILRFILEPLLLLGRINGEEAQAMLVGQVLSAGTLLFALGLLVWRDTLLPPRSLGALAGAALLFELANVLVALGFDPHPAASGDAFELWWLAGWGVLSLAGVTAAADPRPAPPPGGSRERVARRVRASLLPGIAIILALGGVDAATRRHVSSLTIIVLLLLGLVLAIRIGTAFWAVEREASRRRDAEQLAHRAQLQAIANQLNPHFLFNTLHSVSALLEAEPGSADAALSRLGGLLRYTVQGEERLVPLADEWSFTSGYLELEHLHLGDRLHSEMEAEDAALDCLVPRLLVQPLVENAVRHGIAPRPQGGRVRVRAVVEEDILRIEVADDGPGSATESAGEGIGLRGVRARLAAAFADAARMEVTTSPGRGFTVALTLPALEEEE